MLRGDECLNSNGRMEGVVNREWVCCVECVEGVERVRVRVKARVKGESEGESESKVK